MLAVITTVVAFFVSAPVFGPVGALMAAVIAAVSAVAVGMPALALARRFGLRGVVVTTILGGAVGTIPFLLWGAVILLWDGPRAWPPPMSFYFFEGLAWLIGASSGAIHALMEDHPPEAARGRLLAAIVTLGLAAAAPVMLAQWPSDRWPRTREERETLPLSWSFGSAVDETGTREVRLWRAEKPRCVASVYLPALATALTGREPGTLYAEIVRVRRMGRAEQVRVLRFGGLAAPSGPGTFLQGCTVW